MLSLALDYRVWGLDPFGYHLTNVALHALTAVLVCVFLWPIMPSLGAATLAALVFALHPLQMEAVTLAIQRKTLLSALFAILTILPRYGSAKIPSPDDPNFNLLFFNHFSSLSEDDFTARMGRLGADPNQAQDALVRDLYQQGRMLAERKYRYLKLCYRIFFLGILASAVVGGWELLRN